MKDPWIKSFQDRLGDYELDIPVPSAYRKRRIWPLFLTAGAAAAAAALLLLLPARTTDPASQSPLRLPGERQTALLAEATPQPLQLATLSRRQASGRVNVTPAVSATDEPGVVEEVPVAEAENTVTETPETTVREEAPKEETTTGQEWWKTEDPTVRRTTGAFSTQIHVGNAFSSLAAGDDTPDPSGISQINQAEEALWLQNAYAKSNVGMRGDVREIHWRYRLPVKAGVSLRYQITPVLGVESGLEYSYHLAEATEQTARFHYVGIPVKVSARLAQWGRLQVYTALGEETEWLIAGQIETHEPGIERFTTRVDQHPLQFSLTGAAGLDYTLTPGFSLYVEPGLAWHSKMKGDLPSYYREHPYAFDLRAGLRFTL